MARLTKIYTRKGDDGTTGLGSGARVQKDDLQVEAYGEVDELNAIIGLVRRAEVVPELEESLARIQSELFNLGGMLSMIGEEGLDPQLAGLVAPRHVEALERECDRFNAELGPLEDFILPGGSEAAARLHLARTVARRAERRLVTFARQRAVPETALGYLNRLSDLLFIMARYENKQRGVGDVLWDKSV